MQIFSAKETEHIRNKRTAFHCLCIYGTFTIAYKKWKHNLLADMQDIFICIYKVLRTIDIHFAGLYSM